MDVIIAAFEPGDQLNALVETSLDSKDSPETLI
jgi:hypothetical protein